jgi:hypothetical protein
MIGPPTRADDGVAVHVGCRAMGATTKLSDWRMKSFRWVLLPLMATMLLYYGSFDLVPAWRAHNGNGTVGIFSADEERCSRTCSFYGTWTAADGSSTREDVIIYDEPDSLRVGGQTEAIDSGARKGVFASSGGWMYLLITGLTLGGAVAAVGWVIFVVRTLRRRWAEKRSADPRDLINFNAR